MKVRHMLPIAAIAVVAAFGVGRYTAPAKVEVKTEEVSVDVVKETEASEEKTKIEYVFVKEEKQHVRRVEKETVRPDGTVERVKTEEIKSETGAKEEQVATTDRVDVRTVETVRIEEKVVTKTIETKRPDWIVGVMVGTDLTRVDLRPNAPWVTPLVVGGRVERRIFGPVYAGPFAMSNGVIGLGVTAQF
ncbi:hypothetical protein [Myxococcus phage Mx1]|nr:hypothetical protein [Myxococcus phage Mx1]